MRAGTKKNDLPELDRISAIDVRFERSIRERNLDKSLLPRVVVISNDAYLASYARYKKEGNEKCRSLLFRSANVTYKRDICAQLFAPCVIVSLRRYDEDAIAAFKDLRVTGKSSSMSSRHSSRSIDREASSSSGSARECFNRQARIPVDRYDHPVKSSLHVMLPRE